MSTEDEDGEDRIELVMPFVAVKSNGGLYEDEPWVAGFEMGLLDGKLLTRQLDRHWQPIHAHNRAQADLIAMKSGYAAEITEYPEHLEVDGWLSATFTREERTA